jgi:IS30 family transposase
MKNKESRSAANGFISIPTKISAKEEIYTSTCVARKNAVNVMAYKTTGNLSPTVSAFSQGAPCIVAQKPRIGDWKGDTVIGKDHQGVVTTHIECKTKSTPSPKTTDWSSPSTRISLEPCRPISTFLILILPGNGV